MALFCAGGLSLKVLRNTVPIGQPEPTGVAKV